MSDSKKPVAVVAALLIAAAVLGGVAISIGLSPGGGGPEKEPTGGSGDFVSLYVQGVPPEDCYSMSDNLVIDSQEALRNFFHLLENHDYRGKTVHLEGDFSIGDISYPAGTNPFRGVFLGNGHTLSDGTVRSSAPACGVFPALSDAEIRELCISDVSVFSGDCTSVGILAGTGSGNCIITGCSVEDSRIDADSDGMLSVGCIMGSSEGTLKIADTEVTDCSIDADADDVYIGGIVGTATSAEISGCSAEGSIICSLAGSGCSAVGGLAGKTGTGSIITGCTNGMNLGLGIGSSADIGGVCGFFGGSSVSACTNEGTIDIHSVSSDDLCVGGIIGRSEGTELAVRNITNGSDISLSVDNSVNGNLVLGGTIGKCDNGTGALGYMYSSGDLSVNIGSIAGGDISVGGVCGITKTSCVPAMSGSSGDITLNYAGSATESIGSIAGSVVGAGTVPVTSCFGTGQVELNGVRGDAVFIGTGSASPENSYYLDRNSAIISWSSSELDPVSVSGPLELYNLFMGGEGGTVWYLDDTFNNGYPFVADSGVTEYIHLNGGTPVNTPGMTWVNLGNGVYKSAAPIARGYAECGCVEKDGHVLIGVDTVSDNGSITISLRWADEIHSSSATVSS